MSDIRKLCGYVDVEVHLDRKSSRDQVMEKAIATLGARRKWWHRTRVTNLVGGQFGVRFYE